MIREEGGKEIWQYIKLKRDIKIINQITASYERTRKALDTAEERNVDVIVTPYTLEDFDDEENYEFMSSSENPNKWIEGLGGKYEIVQ